MYTWSIPFSIFSYSLITIEHAHSRTQASKTSSSNQISNATISCLGIMENRHVVAVDVRGRLYIVDLETFKTIRKVSVPNGVSKMILGDSLVYLATSRSVYSIRLDIKAESVLLYVFSPLSLVFSNTNTNTNMNTDTTHRLRSYRSHSPRVAASLFLRRKVVNPLRSMISSKQTRTDHLRRM